MYRKYNGKVFYVSISDADRSPELDYIATIHHGIDLENFTFRPEGGDYLLFFGRIHNDKGTREAIEIAKRASRKLVIAGVVQDREYFERWVEPHINGERQKNITYVGSAGPELRDKLLGNAYALLHPINFDEPFGFSVVESMACGTPVIAMNRGSMPELIENGVNGLLVSSLEEAVDAVEKVEKIDRARCRKTVEERFTAENMADQYIKVYKRIIEKAGASHE